MQEEGVRPLFFVDGSMQRLQTDGTCQGLAETKKLPLVVSPARAALNAARRICRRAHARARSYGTLSEVGLAWFDLVRWWELWEADRFVGFQHGSLSYYVSKAFRGAGNRSRTKSKAAPLRKRSRELH